MHGTHVAGIAVAGNPYARIAVARIEFGHTLLPDPCPSQELAEKDARNIQAYVDFMKKNGVRVVNMSWGGSVKGIEDDLELCGIGKTPDERKAIARKYFDIQKDALAKAFASAPEILFVAAAGNATRTRRSPKRFPRRSCAEPADRRRGRQGRRRSVVHELRSDRRRARQRLSGGKRDPRRRQARGIGHVDGVAAGRQPRRQDAGGQSERSNPREVIR